jgi:four helix bundle protein
MENDNLKEKSFKFSVRIAKLYKYLIKEKKEYVFSKQMLRSGTSIGANIRESRNAESKMDFIHKLGIAQKEADETMCWLELLKETDNINETEFNSIYPDAEELLKIIRTIILNTKKNILNFKQ